MANAFVLGFTESGFEGTSFRIYFRASYIGADVPGGSTSEQLSVLIDPTLNATQINSAIGDAVRAFATSMGFTVPSSSVIISSVSKA